MLIALLGGPVGKILFFGGMLATIVPIMADRSRHRPGNIAPVQLISILGTAALLLIQETKLVTSICEGSLIVACASSATLLTTVILFLRGDRQKVVVGQTPDAIEAMVGEIQQILGGAHRAGIESVTAAVVAGTGPFIGVSVPRRGHVVVRVRQDLIPWLARHRRPGGAGSAATGSLLRFTFLHELGHVLNGDHLTYRFVRSALVAHLWWIAAIAAAIPWAIFGAGGPAVRDALVTSLCLVPPFLAQHLLARRFLAEREEDADLRAMQTLDPADALLLATRKPQRSGPTLLERLMIDLHVQAPLAPSTNQGPSRVVRWIWPEAGRIHERSELLVNGHGGRSSQPKRWAVWMGIQCGLLSVSILAAFVTTRDVALIVMALICSMSATYCGMRVDPALVRLHDLKKAPLRRTVGAIFYFSFSASALLLHLLPAFSGTLSYPLFFLAVIVSAPQVLFGSFAAATIATGNPEDAGRTLRPPVLRAAPAILISVAINIGCSLFAAWCFGVAWQGPAIVTFAGVIASTVSSRSRSTNAAVRAVAPIAILESPGGIYAIRILWRELYFDRCTMSDLRVGLIGLSTYTAIALFFASGAAFAARIVTIVAGEGVVLSVLLLVSVILVVFEARVPKRTSTTAHLYDLEHLQMFESLLAAVKTARLPSGKLNEALALWMTSDADLPQAVLPAPRSIWKLESLLALIRITRAVGEEERLSAWRGPIVDALQRIITNGAVTPIGLRPSLGYTILAAQIIDEAGLASSIPIDPMLDSIAGQLEQWLSRQDRSVCWPSGLGVPAAGRARPSLARGGSNAHAKPHGHRIPSQPSNHAHGSRRDRCLYGIARRHQRARPPRQHRPLPSSGGAATEFRQRRAPAPRLLSHRGLARRNGPTATGHRGVGDRTDRGAHGDRADEDTQRSHCLTGRKPRDSQSPVRSSHNEASKKSDRSSVYSTDDTDCLFFLYIGLRFRGQGSEGCAHRSRSRDRRSHESAGRCVVGIGNGFGRGDTRVLRCFL